jgi:hypothetical protein
MVGLSATKAGSGEKEKAYIVRENSILRGILCLIVLGGISIVVLFSTYYELHVAKRGLVLSEVIHHRREHQGHEELIRANLNLQQTLETVVNEARAFAEFRAHFEKSAGMNEDEIEKLFKSSGVEKPELLNKVKEVQRSFTKDMELYMGKLLKRYDAKSHQAQKQIDEISEDIEKTVQHDAEEDVKFEEKLEELGVDEEYAEDIEEDYQEQRDEGKTQEEKDEIKHDEGEAEKEVETDLQRFYDRLQTLSVTSQTPETIKIWQSALDSIVDQLDDTSKEVDLEAATQKMKNLIASSTAINDPESIYDPTKHDSPLEFYEAYIEKVKIMPFKQQLVDMWGGYQASKKNAQDSKKANGGLDPKFKVPISALTLLANIESLAHEHNLYHLLDWLAGEEPDPNTPFEDKP